MQKTCALLVACGLASASAHAVTVGIDDSSAPWLAFMNVFELPPDSSTDRGGFVFGSPWGVPDLVTQFDDANAELAFSPNTIGDPNEFWYQDPTGSGNMNPGGPGAPGNKIMEANLFQQVDDGSFAGQMVTFQGDIISNSLTDAHTARVFIREFTSGFALVNETLVEVDSGSFSIDLATTADSSNIVQWGVQLTGVNVWVTDVDPFGEIVFQTIPAPGSGALLAVAGLAAARRRRH